MSADASSNKPITLSEAVDLLQIKQEERTFPQGLKSLASQQLVALGAISVSANNRREIIRRGSPSDLQALLIELSCLLPGYTFTTDSGLPTTLKKPVLPIAGSIATRPGMTAPAPRPGGNAPV